VSNELPEILKRVKSLGHVVFTNGQWNVNLIGVRNSNRKANQFDDELHVVFKDHRDQWVDLSFTATTDPGTYWLHNPMRAAGTAILVAGQYRGSHKIGMHRGRYPALVQHRPVKVYRDRNRDNVLDMDPNTAIEGIYGINIHHAGYDSHRVDKWSAGCTVIGSLTEWDAFMAVIRRSADLYGERFTYTLIE
jgi:hypothetical protein|tara:strand:- start:4316 stop:4888 length:573 start_codon:yes stop_codon:yes gene_type:complete